MPAQAGGAPSPWPAPRMHGKGGCRWGCSRPARHSVLVQEEGCYHQGRARFPPHPAPSPNSKKKKKSKTHCHPPCPRAPRPSRPRPACSERGEPTASVCGCARLQVSAGRGCGRGPGRPRGGRGGGGRGGAARKKRVLAALGGTRQLQEVRAAPAARRERGRAWGRGAPGAAQAGERARAAARRRRWLPRARAPISDFLSLLPAPYSGVSLG